MNSKLVSFLALSGALVGCGGSSGTTTTGGSMTINGTNTEQFATSSVTLPSTSSQYAWDMDGDGTPDDRLGTIIGVLNAASPPQTAVNSAVAAGELLVLLEVESSDSTQTKAANAGTFFQLAAVPATAPKYDGTDSFTGTGNVSTFYGSLSNSTFTSLDPAHQTVSTDITVELPLVDGSPAVNLPIHGGRITYTIDSTGKITGGQINGALKKIDLDNVVIPAVAQLLTAKLQADPTNTTFKMFDTNGDGMVSTDEIENNSLLKQFLAPDIQMYAHTGTDISMDSDYGAYQPTPNGSVKDCLSVGLAFTGVKATYTSIAK